MAGMAQCVSKVELRLECKGLMNKDVTSKSDPCAVLYMQQTGGNLIEVGRTENIQNSLDPKFVHCFEIDYFFEEVQKIKIAVYDVDNKTYQLEDDDFLGHHECTLGQVVASSPYMKPLVLKNGKPAGKGTLIIRAEEQKSSSEQAYFTFQAKKLENKDFLGKSDPYLEICKVMSDGLWQTIHRTEVVKNNLNPSWRPFKLSVGSLCSGDKDKQLKIDVYDWDSDGSHDFIGGFTTTLNQLLQAGSQEMTFPCINEKKKAKKKSYTDSGKVILTSCKIVTEHTFLDFIFGGMQINFTVGVDFTASNGNISDPKSLHYINPYQPNEYVQAIQAVGNVCQDYDSDKMFPALGFGAKIPPNNQVSHEFALNFNPTNPYCAGIQGIVDAYQNCIKQIRLYGPTNIAPLIYHMAQFALVAQKDEPTKGASAYFVLLLLTDGIITDMDATRQAIVYASSLPMSLIIVGVGDADFTAMEFLDGDEGVLKAANGQPVVRDIVQFVPFRQFKSVSSVSAEVLAKNVLAEVPKQVTDYYRMKQILPKPKPQQSS